MVGGLGRDFWIYWSGQAVSSFGSSFTGFALPLVVFRLTGSALDLAFATAAGLLPYLLFGLVIGAWTDRADRRRLMIGSDLALAAIIGSVTLAATLGVLSVGWIYATLFASSTVGIVFGAASFGILPSLVRREDLVTANGRLTASFSAAQVLGPLAAGALVLTVPLTSLFLLDALSFLVSAGSLALVRFGAAAPPERPRTSIRADIVEGLWYVARHPVLRNISVMMALVNFVGATRGSQLVLFAKERFGATDAEVSLLFSAGSAGVIALSLAAGPLRRRWTFGNVSLGALMAGGLLVVVMAVVPSYWAAVVAWGLGQGMGTLFNINTGSLRQAIVPTHLLGRIVTVAQVLAWSAIPLGAILGGAAIEATGNVALVYAAVGIIIFGIAFAFRAFTALGHAERYVELAAKAAPAPAT